MNQVQHSGDEAQSRSIRPKALGMVNPSRNRILKSMLHFGLDILRDFVALHSHFVNGPGLGWIAIGQHEWRNVLNHFRTAAHNGHLSNSAELVHRRQAADHGEILHNHMPGERAHVGHDHMISEGDVVSHMAIGKYMVVRTNEGRLAVLQWRYER